jgi:hypothetical protein
MRLKDADWSGLVMQESRGRGKDGGSWVSQSKFLCCEVPPAASIRIATISQGAKGAGLFEC